MTTTIDSSVPANDSELTSLRHQFLTPFQSLLNVAQILTSHALLAAWFYFGCKIFPLGLYIVISLPICLIHQRAMSEWIHEGAHFNLVCDRRWNDWLANVLAGFWLVVTIDSYRTVHFLHHASKYFFIKGDPDTNFLDISSRQEFQRAILRDLFGITMFGQYRRFRDRKDRAPKKSLWFAAIVTVQCLNLAILIHLGRVDTYVLYYGSLAFLYPLLNRIRVYGQHVAVDGKGKSHFKDSAISRTIDAGFFDRLFFTSSLLLYHYEHHQFPWLPYRALKKKCVFSSDINRYSESRWSILKAIYSGLPE